MSYVLSFHRFYRSGARFRHAWRPRWRIIRRIFYLGWPKGLEQMLQSGLFATIALLIGWRLGVEAIASHIIALQVYSVTYMVIPWTIASAVTTRVGIASGADDYTQMWRILNAGLLVFFFFLLPLAALLKIFSPWVVMLFLGSDLKAQTLLPIASPLLVIVAFFILANGLRTIAGQALNGLSDMRMPALMMGLGYWGIGFPAALVFGLGMDFGILGFWWELTVGMAAIRILYLARFRWLVERLSAAAPGNGLLSRHSLDKRESSNQYFLDISYCLPGTGFRSRLHGNDVPPCRNDGRGFTETKNFWLFRKIRG
uniref:MatE protein n=1 Tax=Candidatus Kentrum sp. UNK TaxID=2126344 RepID=A0A451A8H0_9GAMM|nr:MAG: MatE protein [Candidatus Kentron sp. UNK]VFK70427.1 MAG: MatE protein [Candidatus Kentron sp. UNK]